jgi:uncharacterized membrane protein
MESRAKLFGHAIHPILIVFPLGLLATAVVFDLVSIMTGSGFWSQLAFWMIAAGIVGGLAAALFGFIDYLAIPKNTRARSVGFLHGLGNVVVVGLFVVSWSMRRPNPLNPGFVAYALSFAGAGLALLTGWLGGELVGRLGVGVDDGANLNAPNSLSGRPAGGGPSQVE